MAGRGPAARVPVRQAGPAGGEVARQVRPGRSGEALGRPDRRVTPLTDNTLVPPDAREWNAGRSPLQKGLLSSAPFPLHVNLKRPGVIRIVGAGETVLGRPHKARRRAVDGDLHVSRLADLEDPGVYRRGGERRVEGVGPGPPQRTVGRAGHAEDVRLADVLRLLVARQ